MGTRIQDKSRPTKRPMAVVSGTPSGYVSARSGYPKTDKKGYPSTNGVPIPVLVDGSFPVGPVGTVRIGTWRVGDGDNPGEFDFVYPLFSINRLDSAGNDVGTLFEALVADDTVYFATTTGSNTLNVESVTGTNDTVEITVNAESVTGIISNGQIASVWITAP